MNNGMRPVQCALMPRVDVELGEDLTHEDYWQVIASFFEDKGLVRQQLDSFDEFIQNTMQELVDENSQLVLQTTAQHSGQEGDITVCSLRVTSN